MSDRTIALFLALLGSAIYFALAFGAWPSVESERFGTFVYNYYFLALTEGRFDVPIRVVTLEGHYDPDGRAFVYHGLAPLITRAIAWPFVDLSEVSLSPLTVALSAVAGTAVYHLVFVQILARYGATDIALRRGAGLLLGIMIWFASPGLLLVVNDSLFHEPTAMAYLFVSCFLGLLAQVVLFQEEVGQFLLPLAVFAGLCLFARPHLAVGLYAAVCLLALVLLWQKKWSGLAGAAGAGTILLVFGLALLVFNELRFGNMLQMSSGGAVEYGFTFWGVESSDSLRLTAVGGTFHAGRIPPNLMLYLFDWGGGDLGALMEKTFRELTSGFGYIRIERPRVGMVFLWLPWFAIALAGLPGGVSGVRLAWAPVLATGIGALLMASYVTVTLRYRFDLWPFLAVLAMLGLPRILRYMNDNRRAWDIFVTVLVVTLVPSLFIMLIVAYGYAFSFDEQGLFSRWSHETCAEMVTAKETLGPGAVERLCGL